MLTPAAHITPETCLRLQPMNASTCAFDAQDLTPNGRGDAVTPVPLSLASLQEHPGMHTPKAATATGSELLFITPAEVGAQGKGRGGVRLGLCSPKMLDLHGGA